MFTNTKVLLMTTMIMTTPRVKLASDAVTTLDVVSRRAWSSSNLEVQSQDRRSRSIETKSLWRANVGSSGLGHRNIISQVYLKFDFHQQNALYNLPERQVKAKCTYATTSVQDNLELRNPFIRSKRVKSCHQARYH